LALEGAGFGVEGGLALFVEGLEEAVECGHPAWSQEGGVAGVVVELVGEGEEVRERVKFVFAFEDLAGFVGGVDGVALAVVACVDFAGGRGLESVAVGCFDYVFGLGVDCA